MTDRYPISYTLNVSDYAIATASGVAGLAVSTYLVVNHNNRVNAAHHAIEQQQANIDFNYWQVQHPPKSVSAADIQGFNVTMQAISVQQQNTLTNMQLAAPEYDGVLTQTIDCLSGLFIGALATAVFLKGRRWALYHLGEMKREQVLQQSIADDEQEKKEKYHRDRIIKEIEEQLDNNSS